MRELREIPKHDTTAGWLYKYGKKPKLFGTDELEAAKKKGWVDSPAKATKPKPKPKPILKKVSEVVKEFTENTSLLDED